MMQFLIFGLLLTMNVAMAMDFQNTDEWPKTKFEKHNVPFSEIISGGPPKDGIPAIDDPKFVKIEQAEKWLKPQEPVIVVEHTKITKAYPLQIMMYHEIVNDQIADVTLSVTFCPLCNASIVFRRDLNGIRLDFGTTGRLRFSDLIMYDRQTESWWQQFTGEAIVGDYTGMQLKQLPSSIISFQQFKQQYPQGKVLSRETGHQRPYGRNPYVGYDDVENKPFLLTKAVDGRLPPMERVLSITIDEETRLYPFSLLEEQSVLIDHLNNKEFVIFNTGQVNSALDQARISDSKSIPSFTVFSTLVKNRSLDFISKNQTILDKQTGSLWSPVGKAYAGKLRGSTLKPLIQGQHFAFAWLAFNPNVEIYRPNLE